MRRTRTRLADDPADRTDPAATGTSRSRANGWPVLPLRLFLGALFCFAGYAKFAYPRFFEPASPNGFKAAVDASRDGSPIEGVLGPLVDHPSLFGHLTAYAEIAIGLGLLVGLLTRLAALGGIMLTLMIALSIAWNGIKEYTGSSGWFTSSELALAAALTVFLLGGAGPLALDNLFIRAKERQRARDDAEPSFRDSDIDDSRRRLQGEPGAGYGQPVAGQPGYGQPVAGQPGYGQPGAGQPGSRDTGYGEPTYREAGSRDLGSRDAGPRDSGPGAGTATAQLPTSHPSADQPQADQRTAQQPADQRTAQQPVADQRTAQQPVVDQRIGPGQPSGYRASQQDEEYRDDPEPEPTSSGTQGRRTPEQPPTAEPRSTGPSGPGER